MPKNALQTSLLVKMEDAFLTDGFVMATTIVAMARTREGVHAMGTNAQLPNVASQNDMFVMGTMTVARGKMRPIVQIVVGMFARGDAFQIEDSAMETRTVKMGPTRSGNLACLDSLVPEQENA